MCFSDLRRVWLVRLSNDRKPKPVLCMAQRVERIDVYAWKTLSSSLREAFFFFDPKMVSEATSLPLHFKNFLAGMPPDPTS